MQNLFNLNNLILIFISILVQIIFIYFFRFFALKYNLLDSPNYRKVHEGNIPLIGGLTIYFSILFLINFIEVDNILIYIFYISFIILFFGFLDDKFQISITLRLLAQLTACLIAMSLNIMIIDLGNYLNINLFNLGIFGFILTILSVIGITNAINFMDGIDGLSSSLSLIALFSIIFYSLQNNTTTNVFLLILLMICLIIFLFSNFGYLFPKSFLGDSGSMFLGFFIGWLLIFFTHPDNRNFHPVLAIWSLSIPAFDLLSVFTRRIIKNINPFKPDRRHIHHILLSAGFSNKKTLFIIIFMAIFNVFFGYYIYIFLVFFYSLISFFLMFFLYIFISIYIGRYIN